MFFHISKIVREGSCQDGRGWGEEGGKDSAGAKVWFARGGVGGVYGKSARRMDRRATQRRTMSRFIVQGGRPVGGEFRPLGNKNAALPMIAAALLTEEAVALENVPDITDVDLMLAFARRFGAEVRRDKSAHTVTICAKRLRAARLDPDLSRKIRTSILFAGPLLARLGYVALPPPGGDGIGHRRLDTHFDGFVALGASTKLSTRVFSLRAREGLKGANLVLDEASVTATENLLMAASLAKGRTVIYNAACEPHVRCLADMLRSMGAKIEGAGTNRLVIDGVERLSGTTHRVCSDLVEAGSYLVAAAVTDGSIRLENVDIEDFEILSKPFRRFGLKWQSDAAAKTITYASPRRRRIKYDFGDAIPSVADGPWPMFPSDLMSILIVLATQTKGTCLFFEKMFESRLYFVDHLIGMGAKIVHCDPHRVVVTGKSQLHGTIVSSPDIRAGIALILAALCAKGETTILNADSIDRGYEAVEKELSALGAEIRRLG